MLAAKLIQVIMRSPGNARTRPGLESASAGPGQGARSHLAADPAGEEHDRDAMVSPFEIRSRPIGCQTLLARRTRSLMQCEPVLRLKTFATCISGVLNLACQCENQYLRPVPSRCRRLTGGIACKPLQPGPARHEYSCRPGVLRRVRYAPGDHRGKESLRCWL